MLEGIAVLCLFGAIVLLIALSVVDLKTRLLPNEMVAGFATLGILFHLTTLFQYLPATDMALGGLTGFGSFYLLRAVANYIYKMDALGLGDVKLMGAGGLWLGPDALMIAFIAGASASILHGLGYAVYQSRKTKTKMNLSGLQIPAGPGFAIGLFLAGLYKLSNFTVF